MDNFLHNKESFVMNDHEAMRVALACARGVEGRTSPRPPVGAVVVQNDILVSQGATAPPYGPHAEVQALEQAGPAAQGATLYVTLEPCCIHVHTPPCTAAIIAAGIRRVVVAIPDPNPRVCTQGMAQLRAAGIEVTLLEDCPESQEAARLCRPFATYITRARPHVTAKWAMTLDGKLASHTGDAFWISGPDARSWVHALRDRVDAILIGAGTARVDNPQLTVRLTPEQQQRPHAPDARSPLRVIMTASGNLPNDLLLLQPELAGGTCVITGKNCPEEQCQSLLTSGIELLTVDVDNHGQPDILAALHALAERGIMHVLLEGGAHLLGSAFDRQCIDHVAAFIAPRLIGGSGAPSPIAGQGLAVMQHAYSLINSSTHLFKHDVLIEGDVVYEPADAYAR
jgi:diaminohydroxyphosphoribosylaminopyrimidine deaminase / 5-amino-6-(5-phosphoribosylamino)uracil reductase